ncbi:MAG: DUF58 domain-containing protein [Bacteroidetes bacterium]|nr:DUF58 domain-containing protein [Bacteroidota bacterium]MCW5895865.1 DUF58 domain-containing protein [Bacteroidota bacterium]
METRELLKKVRQIEIKTRGLVNQVFSGEYHSVFKGRGMEFSEVREYQFGDDIRSIDWNVSARFNHPFVKIFEEERELTVMLLVDFSKSGSFGSVTHMKNEIAAEICAVLSFSAIKNNDKVGLILFTDAIEKFVPPKKGRAHILRIIRELISFTPTGTGTNIKQALEYFNHVNKKRTIAFLISDFIDEGYDQILRIVSKKHDVIAIELSDPREEQMPDAGLIKMRDAETNTERWIDTGDRRVRAHIEQFWKQRNEARKQLFLRSRVDAIPVRIDRPYIKPIVDFFRLREKRL